MGDRDNLPELAEGWIWSTLGEVFDVYVGATPSRQRPEYWKGNIPWVSSGEVAFCQIRETRETITELGLQNTSTTVRPPGTVLLGMIVGEVQLGRQRSPKNRSKDYPTKYIRAANITEKGLDLSDVLVTTEVRVGELPLQPGDKMIFLFDFGDNWEFDVQLEEIQPPNAKIKKPKILERRGEAPSQYWNEEDDWEEDDE
jgi:hypothetical protein